MAVERYDHNKIEAKWSKIWEETKAFKTNIRNAKKPFYNLMMFPYPSGEGLHVGHVYAFGGSDTYGRFKRLNGEDVFEPMGFDAFGIHSENYAIKVNTHPKDLIEKTTTYFREEQLKKLGALFDWNHQVITSDPNYYKWTQWLFIQLFKAGLAVRKKSPVDWCPSCKTVLADEQVIAGKCERCGSEVIQKDLEQWFFKITDYTGRLLKNLEWIDWSESTKTMQKNWIGKSEGVEIDFPVAGSTEKIKVFTTRPDTVFGATFIVLAPEHPLIEKSKSDKVKDYVAKAGKKSEIERTQEKTGVFTGLYALNSFTKKEIPIWVADYVLWGYGTGAIMAVPAHDQRDFEFAKQYNLPIVEVISGGDISKEAYLGEGKLVNSGDFNGLGSKETIDKISKYIESNQLGKKTTSFHLRDWLISRQRYWGPPIPMIFCERCAGEKKSWFTTDEAKGAKSSADMVGWYPVTEEDLPVELPYIKDYQPKGTGVGPLAAVTDFVNLNCPGCGSEAKRETDVSDTFLDSAWYFLRYPTVGEPNSEKIPFDIEVTKKWLPVDMYIGGNEHAVLHLLYTRFITMALKDMKFIDFEEPFKRFRAHGLIIHEGAKMSKSRGNVVNPNEYMDAYGSDALRMYLLFIGPYELGGDFSDRAIAGVYRFLNRVWKLVPEISKEDSFPAKSSVRKEINRVVKKVGEDVTILKFNTAIAALMEFLNFAQAHKEDIDIETIRKYLIILSIFAPFTTEELWSRLGTKGSIHDQIWPKLEKEDLKEESVRIPVQVGGRLRDTIEIKADSKEEEVVKLALSLDRVKKYLKGKPKKTIYIPGKILNIVP